MESYKFALLNNSSVSPFFNSMCGSEDNFDVFSYFLTVLLFGGGKGGWFEGHNRLCSGVTSSELGGPYAMLVNTGWLCARQAPAHYIVTPALGYYTSKATTAARERTQQSLFACRSLRFNPLPQVGSKIQNQLCSPPKPVSYSLILSHLLPKAQEEKAVTEAMDQDLL